MSTFPPNLSVANDSPGVAPRLSAHFDYLRLMVSRASGTAANQMLMVALGWQMYDLTHSAWDLGLVGLAQFVPALLLTLPAGHWVDRHDRRQTLALSLLIQAVVALVLVVGSLGAWVGPGWVLAVSVLLGCARAVQMPSMHALLPSLVPASLLPRAVAVSSSTMQSAVVLGPALGGLLYAAGPGAGPWLASHVHAQAAAHAGAALVYSVTLLFLALAVLAVLAIRHRPAPVVAKREGWAGVTAGVHFILQRPVLLGAVSLDLFAVLLGGATALLPIFARDILHTGPEGLGLLRSAPALGAVLLGLYLAHRPIERRTGPWLMCSVALYGVATLGFGLARDFWLAFAALFVTGAADMVSVVIRQSLVQLETPDDMRGRVAAVNSVFIGASNQLGEFESGATAAALGPVGSVVLGGVGTLVVVGAWLKLFPALAQRDALHTPQPGH